MTQDLISVIVPIYNVEDYIRQCFDSLLNQTYQNFEVLMINDGSPDNSASICQEYAARDSRFRYFEKENGGASSARNMGIERSGGGVHYLRRSGRLVRCDLFRNSLHQFKKI